MIKPGTPVWVSDKSQEHADAGGLWGRVWFYIGPSIQSNEHIVEDESGNPARWKYVYPLEKKPRYSHEDICRLWFHVKDKREWRRIEGVSRNVGGERQYRLLGVYWLASYFQTLDGKEVPE